MPDPLALSLCQFYATRDPRVAIGIACRYGIPIGEVLNWIEDLKGEPMRRHGRTERQYFSSAKQEGKTYSAEAASRFRAQQAEAMRQASQEYQMFMRRRNR